jgi:hypothetical protein
MTRKQKRGAAVRSSDLLDRRPNEKINRIGNPCLGSERFVLPLGVGKEAVCFTIHLANSNRIGLRLLRAFLRRIEPDVVGRPHCIRVNAYTADVGPFFGSEPWNDVGVGFHKRERSNEKGQP